MKSLAVWLVFAALLCSADAAGISNPRFLVAVDASFSTSRQFEAIRSAVSDMVVSGFAGQIRPGERFEIWSFNERVQKLVIFEWQQDSGREAIRQVELALSRQKHRGQTDFRLLSEAVSEVARTSPVFTFILLTDGEDDIIGTPFDARVNRAFAEKSKILKRERQPFVVVMLAESGSWTRSAISVGGLHIELPVPPALEIVKEVPEPSQKPLEIARAAAVLATPALDPPVPVSLKEPARLPPPRADPPPPLPAQPALIPIPLPKPPAPTLPIVPSTAVAKPLEKLDSAPEPPPERKSRLNADAPANTPLGVSVEPQKSDSPVSGPSILESKENAEKKENAEIRPVTETSPQASVGDPPTANSSPVVEAFLAPRPDSPQSFRIVLIGIGFFGASCILILLWWLRARSQTAGGSSLISQYMEKENTPERPKKR